MCYLSGDLTGRVVLHTGWRERGGVSQVGEREGVSHGVPLAR